MSKRCACEKEQKYVRVNFARTRPPRSILAERTVMYNLRTDCVCRCKGCGNSVVKVFSDLNLFHFGRLILFEREYGVENSFLKGAFALRCDA